MSLDAQVIAIGLFSEAVVDHLEYPASFYASVPSGATVVSNVFQGITTARSRALAAAFGFGPFDLGKHAIDPKNVNEEQLRGFDPEAFERFLALHRAGFQFFFLPNG